jgi:transposase
MMGHENHQGKLFCYNVDLEKRLRIDHPLRKINEFVDFDFIYGEVKEKYGSRGNVSVPPPVILKMLLLLIFYNVRSERELMATIPERLDWLWFLGYSLDDTIPNHSVLSKARARWGVEVFESFFKRIVWQCVEAGIVDGSKLFMDSSLITADASNNSVIDSTSLNRYLNSGYQELEKRLDKQSSERQQKRGIANRKYISTTDPDASVVRSGGKSRLRYKVHRAVDEQSEIITAVDVTPGEVNEAHRLSALLEKHEKNTETVAQTAVADSKYGTVENYVACFDRGVAAHIPDLKATGKNKGGRKDIFPEAAFKYNSETDTYICPAGQTLTRRRHKKKRKAYEYGCPREVCKVCQLYSQCTSSKTGRTVKRHQRHEDLELMRSRAQTRQAKKDIRTRQHLMERSFARAYRYGFKRSRWRRLWRNQIQEYLTAAIQNIMVLLARNEKSKDAMALAMIEMKQKTKRDAGDTCTLSKEWLGIIIVALKRTLFNRNLTQLQRQMAL